LRDNQAGALDDLKIGHHVAVTFEIPDNLPTARRVEQTNSRFYGGTPKFIG
jgi:hypothetical protein